MLRGCSNLCAAVAACLFLSQSAAAQPPVEAFGNLPVISNPVLSPDGRHFAAIQSVNGRPVVVIYPVHAKPGEEPVVAGGGDWIIEGLAWLKNDRLGVAIKVSKKVGDEQNLMHTWTRLVSIDTRGQNDILLFKNNPFVNNNTDTAIVVDRDLDDPDNIFMPLFIYADMRSPGDEATDSKAGRDGRNLFRYDLYRVNVRTGHEERVAAGNYRTKQWFMDGHGHILARQDQSETPLVDHLEVLNKDEWTRLADYDATADRGASIVGITDDGTALVRATRDNRTMAVLTRLDLSTGKESPLFANPAYDADHPLIDDWTNRVIGAAFIDDRVEHHYFSPKLDALQKGLEAAFPGVSAEAVSWDTAMNAVIVAVDAPRKPTTYYYLDRTTHTADPIGSAYPDLSEADLGEMKAWPYKARDGLDIPAYLTLPPGKEAKKLPVVVMPHGGPDARDHISFDWMAQFFANRGYAVLQPNFRGSWGYGHKFTDAGLHQWGLKMQDDITDGAKKMIADGIADPKRICIVGASYGGYAALAGAALTPDLYACAVSFAGVSDLPRAISAERARYGQDSGTVSFWISRIGSPYDDSEQLRATSPARHANQVKCPVLLMHGEGDVTVPIEQSELMNAALKSAGKQVEFIRFAGEDHYLNLADTRIRVLKETEAFLKKNIGN
jgi:dipeptidyl aminopeptidase/acylaminoacyl peptidase